VIAGVSYAMLLGSGEAAPLTEATEA